MFQSKSERFHIDKGKIHSGESILLNVLSLRIDEIHHLYGLFIPVQMGLVT
jgi:hypothetical protein